MNKTQKVVETSIENLELEINKIDKKLVLDLLETKVRECETQANRKFSEVDLKLFKSMMNEDVFRVFDYSARTLKLVLNCRLNSDSEFMKLIRASYQELVDSWTSKGWIIRDEEYYSKTKRTRLVVGDIPSSDKQRAKPSLNFNTIEDDKVKAITNSDENVLAPSEK